jgi:hypothetical protein
MIADGPSMACWVAPQPLPLRNLHSHRAARYTCPGNVTNGEKTAHHDLKARTIPRPLSCRLTWRVLLGHHNSESMLTISPSVNKRWRPRWCAAKRVAMLSAVDIEMEIESESPLRLLRPHKDTCIKNPLMWSDSRSFNNESSLKGYSRLVSGWKHSRIITL